LDEQDADKSHAYPARDHWPESLVYGTGKKELKGKRAKETAKVQRIERQIAACDLRLSGNRAHVKLVGVVASKCEDADLCRTT
jgi:hypothetical protein